MKKRIFATLLALVLVCTSFDISAFAMESKEEVIYDKVEEEVYIPEEDLPSNDELYNGYVETLLYPEQATTWSYRNPLKGTNRAIFNKLKTFIKETANGERTSTEYYIPVVDLGLTQYQWTAEELGMDSIRDENNKVKAEAFDLAREKIGINSSALMDAVVADCPYELYWFDKTVGMKFTGCTLSAGKNTIYLEWGPTFRFTVADEYATGTYEFDTSQIDTVHKAVNNAKAIVDKYSASSDYNKMDSYRKEICSLVSYNDQAASSSSTPYGNPWQLIYVFDKDSSTKVVCEGYAKAFQYLCDLSTFNDCSVNCISVSGYMVGPNNYGGHMWNIVTMEDGKNYLVDITNCDSGTIGADTQLFLKGYSKIGVNDGYQFNCRGGNVEFIYDYDIGDIYEPYELELANTNYVSGNSVSRNLIKYEANAVTCEKDGNIEYYTCSKCKKYFSDAGHQQEISLEDTILKTTGHTKVIDKAEPATCVSTGKTEGKHCSVCGKVFVAQEEIPATGHTAETVRGKEAGCETTGLTKGSKCVTCGKVLVAQEVIPAEGHTEIPISGRNATCELSGITAGSKCQVCGKVLVAQEKIPAKGHVEEKLAGREATCESSGLTEGSKCSVCNKLLVAQEKIPAKGHVEEKLPGREATCDSSGLTEGSKCSVCGKVLVAQKTIYATGHTKVTDKAVRATWENDGKTEGSHCSVCDTVLVEQKRVPRADKIELSNTYYIYDGKTKNPTLKVTDIKGNQLVQGTDYVVTGSTTQVKPGKHKVTVELIGKYAKSKDAYYYIHLAAPTLKATLTANDTVNVSWNKVTGANGYVVYYKAASASKYTKSDVGTKLSKTVTNLSDGTKYEIKVVAYFKDGNNKEESINVSTTNVQTLKKMAAPTVQEVNGKAKVSWDKADGATGYQISKAISANKTSNLTSTTSLSKNVSATKNKNYYYKVRAYKTVNGKKIYGPWSSTTKFNLRTVNSLKNTKAALSKSYNRVKLSWSKSTGANRYKVYMIENGKEKLLITTSKTTYYAEKLNLGTKYSFKIEPCYMENGAVVKTGKAGTASVVTLKAVTNVTVVRSTSKKVTVKWDNMDGETGYQISQSTKATGTSVKSTYKTTSGKSKTIAATKGKTYYYKVRAYKTVDGKKIYGPWSEVVEYRIEK